jgi:uncharacterized membrane protein
MRSNDPDTRAALRRQWADPAHWSGPAWASLYFNKQDPRLWVPKRVPAMGWTVNFGHPRGWLALLAIVVGPVLFVVIVFTLVLALAR